MANKNFHFDFYFIPFFLIQIFIRVNLRSSVVKIILL
jgi:hypothetical protein